MGLGKTLQVIATLQKLRDDGALTDAKALVIVPTSLLTNWQKEIARFAPALSVAVFHGARRELATKPGRTASGRAAHHLRHRPQRGGGAQGARLAGAGGRRSAEHQEPGDRADAGGKGHPGDAASSP
jgi:SNF2 family DNA or RNA helicase